MFSDLTIECLNRVFVQAVMNSLRGTGEIGEGEIELDGRWGVKGEQIS